MGCRTIKIIILILLLIIIVIIIVIIIISGIKKKWTYHSLKRYIVNADPLLGILLTMQNIIVWINNCKRGDDVNFRVLFSCFMVEADSAAGLSGT
jgi:hypothetical protein